MSLEALEQQYSVACAAACRAQDAADQIGAELLRRRLLAYADEHPGVETFAFDVESVYNDEGGYFDSVNLSRDGEGIDEIYDDDLYDLGSSFSAAEFEACFGSGIEEVTVVALRGRS